MTTTTHDSTQETKDHIYRVRDLMSEAIENLNTRRLAHDKSKLEEPEKSAFDRLLALKLSDIPYGSDEYRAALRAEQPAIRHHYEVNDHHPEHYPDGIGVTGMSLMALLEMLADWKAAGERMKDGSLESSIAHNVGRFSLSADLTNILINTARELGWWT